MRVFLRLLALHRPHAGWLALGVVLSLLTLLANVVLMTTSGWFIAAMGLAGAAGVSINYFTPAAVIRACAIVRTTGRYGERLITHDATLRLLSRLRVWLYGVLEPLAPAALGQERSGGLLSRFTADIDTLDNVYLRILLPISVALLASALFVAWLWWLSPALAVAEAGLLLASGLVLPWLLARNGGLAGERAMAAQERLRADTADALQGLGELVFHGADGEQAARIDRIGRELGAAQLRAERWTSAGQALVVLGAWVALWAMLALVAPQVHAGTRPPAHLAMLALFALASFEAVAPLPLAFRSLGATLASARRLLELADRKPPVPEPTGPAPRVQEYAFRFASVGFRYPGSGKPVLEEIDFTIPDGSRTAIVGPTGAGKSTLLQLMVRFQLPSAGRLYFGGLDMRAWPGEALRERLAVADQNVHLFIGTLRQNLLLARPGASERQLLRACDVARLHDWIDTLPRGLDTEIGEAALRISGGEARRLAIARMLLREAPVLILDEPTEGLDAGSARQLMEGILNLQPRRTLILVTHRLNELPRMDQVILLDRGKVLARGDHATLMSESAAYRALMELRPIGLDVPG